MNEYCERCNRHLKSLKSRELGFGPSCYRKERPELFDALGHKKKKIEEATK